jgi:hypothetical protein
MFLVYTQKFVFRPYCGATNGVTKDSREREIGTFFFRNLGAANMEK